jgi:hypothetical protein
MKDYKLSLEINLSGENPLEVSKQLTEMIRDHESDWQFYVQDEETNEIFSVDLQEEDEDAVLPVTNYEPFIIQSNE